jgi:hypothetical protein
MTTLQLIDNNLPLLRLDDTVGSALELLAHHKLTHLAVVNADKYVGLVSEEVLLDIENTHLPISSFLDELLSISINSNQHFLRAIPLRNLYKTNTIPVVNDEKEFLGSIHAMDLLNAVGNFSGANEGGALIILEVERNQLSISEINSIVESEGATIWHFNISHDLPSGLLQVTIQINKTEISTIIATFERYEYSILFYSGEELFENEISTNYQNLMNYLDI